MTVIIGIDPHKATHTAVAIDGDEQPIARLRGRGGPVARRSGCWRGRRRWARNGRGRSSPPTGSGKLLSQQLLAAGEHVVDVPPTLSARVRLLGSTKAAKNDRNDALSTAIAGLRHCGLRAVRSRRSRRRCCGC